MLTQASSSQGDLSEKGGSLGISKGKLVLYKGGKMSQADGKTFMQREREKVHSQTLGCQQGSDHARSYMHIVGT